MTHIIYNKKQAQPRNDREKANERTRKTDDRQYGTKNSEARKDAEKRIEGGAGNIVKYAKKALTRQGGEAVIFETPSHDIQFYKAITEARRKCEGRIFFYMADEKTLKEIQKKEAGENRPRGDTVSRPCPYVSLRTANAQTISHNRNKYGESITRKGQSVRHSRYGGVPSHRVLSHVAARCRLSTA